MTPLEFVLKIEGMSASKVASKSIKKAPAYSLLVRDTHGPGLWLRIA
jgi:hypothetical protein